MSKDIGKVEIDKFADLDLGQTKERQGPQLASAQLKQKPNGTKELASIKKAGEREILTPEEFKERARELKKCKKDIMYFCRKYFKIISLKDGLVTLDPYPKQEELLRFIQHNNRAIVCASRQVGKCVQQNSNITIREVSTGWIETITVGDFFDKYGFSHYDIDDSSGKFVDSVDVGGKYQILTDTVFDDVKAIHKTVQYDVWILRTENHVLECADDHIVFDEDWNEVFVKNLNPGQMIWTEDGLEKVVDVVKTDRSENMYDVELPDTTNHRYYTNGILSHNTTIYTVFLLWYAMYHPDKRIMVCGNKLDIAIEIMDRIRLAYEYCPSSIKIGVTTYNKKCIEFENNSIIRCFATGSSGCRGFSANVLVMDEAAFLPKGIADEFMASVFPVLSSSKDSKAIMVSTPNGTANNLFYDTWQQATDPNIVQDENWKAFRFLWYDVPGRDEEWKRQQIATIGINRWMQEFECEFKSSGDASLVPSDFIEHFRMNLKNYPKPAQLNLSKNPEKEITANFWKPFDPSRTYASSGDISEGTGNDSSVTNIWDVTDVKHISLVARMSCSKATLVDFGYATYEFLKLYGFPPFIVENNGVGSGFVDIMLDTYHYPQDRMFYEQAISPTGKYGEITYGVKSKNKTKLEACMFLNELITTEEIDISIPDELLVNEMGTFVRKNTSNSITFAAKDKCHDDYMLTWIWGMYLLFADVITQHYSVVKAFKTKMDRVLPEKVIYTSPFDQSLLEETLNLEANKGIVSQLGNLEEHKVVRLSATERDIPDDELFYGNRQWGRGSNREFFTINETFDFGNGEEWDDGEEAYNVLTEF